MRAAVPLLVSLALTAAPAARAGGDPSLEQQVKALSETVRALQQRVDRLEGRTPAAASAPASAPAAAPAAAAVPAAAPAASPGAGYVSPEAALRSSLLGAPSKKFILDGRRGWYYYYPGTGGGSVFFSDAGRVSSRQSPFGLGW